MKLTVMCSKAAVAQWVDRLRKDIVICLVDIDSSEGLSLPTDTCGIKELMRERKAIAI